jgi:prepilin-type N-terminal cleavage/methylation domain-containing protein
MKMTRHSRRGMTLMELLVVTIILGLIMSLGLSVGSKMLTRADRRKTIGTMAVVMAAIDAYYEQCGAYPMQSNRVEMDSEGEIREDNNGNIVMVASPPPAYGANQYDYSDFLLKMLKRCPASVKALSALGAESMNEGAYCGPSFVDGFNMPLLYSPTGGLGGAPKLLSAGPDGKYKNGVSIKNESGGHAQMSNKKDDITSGSE